MAPRMKVETAVKPAVESAAGSKAESSATKQKNTVTAPKKAPAAPKPRIDVPASQSKPAAASTPAAAPKAKQQTESQAASKANKAKPAVAIDTPAASASADSSAASSAKPKAAAKDAPPKRPTQTSKPKIVAASTETVQDNVDRNDVTTGNSAQYDAYTAQASGDDRATTGDRGFSGVTQEKMSPKNVGASMSGWVRRTFPGHEHAFVGGMVALLLALLTFVIGPLRVLFICIVVVIGIALGQIADGDPKIIRMIRGLFDNDRDQR